ncbi:MAG: ribonuclease HII [Clostridia bacterium]
MNLLDYERECMCAGFNLICGVDEAGRGPLAGPVVAAALIPDFDNIIEGINDSKKLTDKQRRELYPYITENAVAYRTALCAHDVIDEINILQATKRAMTDGVNSLLPVPHIVLIDAVKLTLPIPCRAIIHGDALSYAIAAASIIAKVERDNMMIRYAELYPEYGFEQHKGYATKMHIERLKKYGPSPIHRKTFIKNFV